MRIYLIFFSLGLLGSLPSQAQNVGVGTGTPTEKLDVNGNLNLNGNLKLNGNAGRAGQVLMMNSGGQQQWANTFGYKNRKEFYSPGTWDVPPGVTEIMIEAIGGGGGGAKGGGGGAGGYAIAVLKVAPGQVVIMPFIGSGGMGSSTENGQGANGNNVVVGISSTSNSITAFGGNAASATEAGSGGSTFVVGDSIIFLKIFIGGGGTVTEEYFSQRSSTEYVTIRKYGNGGYNMYNPHLRQSGSYFSFNTVTLLNLSVIYSGTNSGIRGSGGAGGNTPDNQWGYTGGFGFVAISW